MSRGGSDGRRSSDHALTGEAHLRFHGLSPALLSLQCEKRVVGVGRGLAPATGSEVTQMARRIAVLLLLEPALDANYRAVAAAPWAWGEG